MLWSHWAAEQPKRQFVEEAIRRFQAANPGVTVRTTWYEKNALYAALRTALRAGQGPDVFYAEPDQIEYVQNNFLLDLSQGINWNNVEPWARRIWTHNGRAYGLPLEAWTVEMYVNTRLLQELGGSVPPSLQHSQAEFLDLVRRARARNIVPVSAGVGDRPFPGAFLTHETLLMRLGLQDYGRLLAGDLRWDDPRVVESRRFVRSLLEARAFPPGVATMQLGQSHTYFHTNPGTLFFPMGSWYTSRAFNPPDQGGQPADFPLGVMRLPAPENAACRRPRSPAACRKPPTSSGSAPIWRAACTRSRAGSGSASRSGAPSCATPRCSSSTSRSRTSMPRCAPPPGRSCRACTAASAPR